MPSNVVGHHFTLKALSTFFPSFTLPKSMLLMSRWLLLLLLPGLLSACEETSTPLPSSTQETPPRFQAISGAESGVDFENKLENEVAFNILNYPYFYNGGGVAVGDFNGDSLPDLFFTANQQPNRLYLNRGNFRFEDVTKSAGVAGRSDWSTGVSLADVNGDGHLDIYVSCVVGLADLKGRNELFLNQGDGSFVEAAEQWGLAQRGYGTQATWLDYDRDGDLDLFQLNHSIKPNETIGPASQRLQPDSLAGDRLLRNDGDHFTDVTAQAGIFSSRLGYGLGVLTGDIDGDGWPDLYVCNDFHEDDYLYLNQQDGSYRESLRAWIGHTSKFSMGGDLADFNNDGHADLITLDMKPEVEFIRKTAQPPASYDRYQYKLSFGYYYQYAHNALQLNRGGQGFSEIAQLAGVDATDWSWSALFADYDNDGYKDLFITNGIYRRPDDMDYISFISEPAVVRQLNQAPSEADLAFIDQMPSIPQPNYLYRNQGGLQFASVAAAWGLDDKGFSNGAAYADLDRDGDLDLVVNNLNAPAGLYRNLSREQDSSAYLALRLMGSEGNPYGYGARLSAWTDQGTQTLEHYPVRGFQSCMEPGHLHLGLGQAQRVDSLRITWPDGRSQRLTNVAVNQTLALRQADATMQPTPAAPQPEPVFRPLPGRLDWTHQENDFVDFSREALLPHRLSTQGPRPAVADLNGDGRDDLYLPGPAGQAGQLMLQQADGRFVAQQTATWQPWAATEEVTALFFDADSDGDLDLYVACGGNQFFQKDPQLHDRLFRNEGGTFVYDAKALPPMLTNTGCVQAADYDGDGDLDLFVGGRNLTAIYGLDPRSYLLRNEGGRFLDASAADAPELISPGLITDAQWLDVDRDGDQDLALVGEWMPLTVLRNEQGRLQRDSTLMPPQSNGWWNCLAQADLDGDGDLDLVAGNLGLNSTLRASPQEPCELYVADFDGNGYSDPIICAYHEGRSYPWATRDEMLKQIVSLRRRFPNYQTYAEATIQDLFTPQQLAQSVQKRVYTFAHAWFENTPGGFVRHALPQATQMAPVYGLAIRDVDGNGLPDLVMGGNFFGVGPNRGRYDAGTGFYLTQSQAGKWEATPGWQAGLNLSGEVRAMAWLQTNEAQPCLLVARNGAEASLFRVQAARSAVR